MPAGTATMVRAIRSDVRYLAIGTLPLLFGLQQFVEGLVWTAGAAGDAALASQYSLVYMFFTWIVWPIWVPLSAYALETGARRRILIPFIIAGAMLGGLQYLPYFAHQGWLTTSFFQWSVRYQDINLLDYLIPRAVTYAIYLTLVIVPFLLVRDRDVKIFGLLVMAVVIVTYVFFSYAYISVFCFGAAIVSFHLIFVVWRKGHGTGSRDAAQPDGSCSRTQ
ncbi:hypothetical protein PV773_06710 [Mesorhizobium sp. CC13]